MRSPSKPARLALAFAIAAASVILLYWLRTEVLLVFLALVIAVLLDAVAELGIRFLHMNRGFAVVSGTVLCILVLLGTLALVLFPLAKQGTQFAETLPHQVDKLEQRVDQYRKDFPWLNRIWPKETAQAAPKTGAPELAKKALITASAAVEWAMTALATLFLALFFALNPDRWLHGVAELWPGPGAAQRIVLMKKIGAGLRSYLFMMGFYILAMGAAWTLGLWLIGIEYALLFGVIGGLAEIVPYVGPMLGLIPPLLIALPAGAGKIGAVLGLYAVLHVLEGYVLVPLLMSRREHLPSPLVVVSVLVCGRLFGSLGVVLALPLATAGYVLVNETVYAQRRQRVVHRLNASEDGHTARKEAGSALRSP